MLRNHNLVVPPILGLLLLLAAPFIATEAEAQVPAARPAEAGLMAYQNFTPAEYGLDVHSQNWSVAQDDRGLIYAANGNGVLQYDGVSWRLIPVGNNAYARVVMRGDDGTLYVGAHGEIGYLAADSSGVLSYVSLVEKIDPAVRDFGSVWQGAQTSEGLYFRTSGVLFRWDGEKMRHWVADEGTEMGRIYAVRDTLYVLQWRAGLKRMAQDTLEMVPDGEQYAELSIDAMLPYGKDQILLASYKAGLMLYDGYTVKPFDAEANELLLEREVYTGLLLPDGTYAFSTLLGGVVLMDAAGRVQRVLDERLGLVGQDVKNLFLDRQGGLWLAMETGLARIDLFSPATVWDKRTGLEGAVYIVARHEGTLYAGTATGLTRLTPRTSVESPAASQFTQVADLSGEVFALLSTPHGLLVGTTTGIYVVEGNRSRFIDGADDAYMFEASQREDTRVYAVFRSGLRELQYRQGQWHLSENVAALAGTELHHVHEDETGALWIGSYFDGLWRIDPTAALQAHTPVRYLEPEAGYPQKVYQITPFRGETRIASGEAFLEPVVDNGTVTLVPDTTFEAYTASPIMQIREAADGSIWLHPSSDPLIRLQHQPDDTWTVSRPLTEIANWTAYTAHLDADGTYWAAGPQGLVRVTQPPSILPEATLRSFVRNVQTVGGDSVIFGGSPLPAAANADPARLAHTANALRFEYAAPSYTQDEKTAYQVRLDGFDRQWSDWTDETRKDYTNLPPGEYTFRVRARDYQDRISEEATYAFVLLPPWYQGGWAYAVYLLLAVGLLYAGVQRAVRWRSAKLEAQNRALEQTVAARTLQISEQNERLASQNALLKEQKQHIEAQAQKLKELDEVKNRFFANISHEFRTPLTLMMGPLENILGTTADDEVMMQRAALETSLRNARRLLHLINQLLDLAKLDAGRMSLHTDQGDFVQFLRILAAGFSSLAEQRGITLAFVSEPDYLDARFDTEKLEIAFYNLFSNALKFTPAGGEVVISLSHEDETNAVVSVRDTGIGIPADELPYVFDRFHQVNNALARSHEGTGIGLALVQNLISLHGGSVEVESIEGEGTTFHVRLPIVQDASIPADERKPTVLAEDRPTFHAAPYLPVASTSQPTRKGEEEASAVVYVVDDNAEMRAYIADCLGEQYHMVAAANGQEALRMMRTTPPDLVITDLMMPHMDGYALIKALRRDEVHSRVPILMLTARATDDATINALEAGADEYLAKPFNARELRARVHNMLALQQQARTLQALNEALTHTNELLWQESEAKTQLLGMAAHDLRNPLAGIIGFANVLQEDFDLPAEPQEFIGFIRSNAQQMHGLLEDLLNSVSIESGRITLNKKRLDLAQLAQWVVHSLRPQAEHKQQHLHYKAPQVPCIIEGDELRLREAITNLVTNAIKYSEAGKTIDVEVVKEEGTCKIAVQDEGPGLSQEDQALLFQPFQRLSPRPTNNEPSTGLGLYIVHQLMTLHDGSVTAESERGVGSTFTLVLPATDSQPTPSVPSTNTARIKPRHELGKSEA